MIIHSRLLLAACIAGAAPTLAAAATLPMTEDQAAAALAAFVGYFEDGAIVAGPELVDCTLSGGTETTCFKFSLGATSSVSEGPWCPKNIADGPNTSGIWLNNGLVLDADGPFVASLSAFYNDPTWQLFDRATGEVHVTDTKEACEAAARPDVDAAYRNYCVECLPSYVEGLPVQTIVIPVDRVPASSPSPVGIHPGVGVALNGVKFEGPAPVDAILAAYTLAPFDDCGGHINPFAGYHYHAVTGCEKKVAQPDAHAPLIGFAFDGVTLHTHLNADGSEPQDLDACGGHTFGDLGYHYHVSDAGQNQIIGCFTGEYGCSLSDPDQVCDASRQRRGPPPG